MARLVAMGILADKSGHITYKSSDFRGLIVLKQRVEATYEYVLAPHQFHERLWILKDVPDVLQGIAFGVITA